MSRRDFLRRASKEAAKTGTDLVPGAKIARAALGADGKPSVWERILAWRRRAEPTPPESPPDQETTDATDAG
jgi:hypothetical protein